MSDDTVRGYVVDRITPLLPEEWRIIDHQRMPDTIDRTTVAVKHTRIEVLPEAPLGSLRNTIILTVGSRYTDTARAENDLDDAVTELITALDGDSKINWTLAEKVAISDSIVGWDLTLTLITERSTPED